MLSRSATAYTDLADAAWRWVLEHVEWDDGPWIPFSVDVEGGGAPVPPDPRERLGMHSGSGGLAHALAEVRMSRPWTGTEWDLARGIADSVIRKATTCTDVGFFDGLASHVGVLVALGPEVVGDLPGALDAVMARLGALAGPDGWATVWVEPPMRDGATYTDATLGTAAVVLASLWAGKHGALLGPQVAGPACDVLVREAVETPHGVTWPFVPDRFLTEPRSGEMPNWSHGVAGISAALALAAGTLERPDLLDLARRGAEHLVAVADTSDGGFAAPRVIPWAPRNGDEYTWNWCHGPSGTSLAFHALESAGIPSIAGASPGEWHDRALATTMRSGIPARLHPGFWDNDGRCCGSAGVADICLDAWARTGREDWRAFAVHLADDVAEHATRTGDVAYWRFLEHTADPPLLPPGLGWMQGATGIAALLYRMGRALRDGRDAPAVARMEQWWCVGSS